MAWVTVTLNANGGVLTDASTLYFQTSNTGYGWYWSKSSAATNAVVSISIPTRSGYEFTGFWSSRDGTGTQYIKADGVPIYGNTPSTTIYAGWVSAPPDSVTITLDADGGTGGTEYLYYDSSTAKYYLDRYLTEVATEITVPVGSSTFLGFYYGDVQVIDANGTLTAINDYAPTAAATIIARWRSFGRVTDWFDLSGSQTKIVPISASNGDNAQHIFVSHGGVSEQDVLASGGVWRNPEVTYEVVADLTGTITLGKAYPAVYNGSTMVKSGYMITSVEVVTQLGAFPRIKVKAVANEGVDAINLFPVEISVKARARAQNMMSAIGGGGQLHALTMSASATPVVLTENLMPCASDVVEGKVTMNATVLILPGDTPPVAGDGFVSHGEPTSEGGVDYLSYNISVEKRLEV